MLLLWSVQLFLVITHGLKAVSAQKVVEASVDPHLHIHHGESIKQTPAQPEPTPEPEPFAGILPEAPFLPDSLPRASSLRHQPPAGTHSGSEPDTGLLPQSEPQPEPEPEPNPSTGQNNPAFSEPSVPLPEPAIKFDNIEVEDYGEVTEAVKKQPDNLDDEVIEQLVDRFLNNPGQPSNGAIVPGKSSSTTPPPKVVYNSAAQALIDSSSYWSTDDLKEPHSIKDEAAARAWISGYAPEAQKVLHQITLSGWRYFTNASPTLNKALAEAEEVLARFVRATSKQAKQFDTDAFHDASLKQQLNYVTFEGMNALTEEDATAYSKVNMELNKQASDIAVCDLDMQTSCALKRIDIESIFHSDRETDRLSHLWTTYLRSIAALRSNYNMIIELTNKGAQANGFTNGAAMWLSAFDMSTSKSAPQFDFVAKLEEIYERIAPFYQQLHAYVRRQLAGLYKNPAGLSKDGPIPAHLFGSIEGGDWSAHYEETRPFDEEDTLAEEMLVAFHQQNVSAKHMFIKAYRYLKTVGFPSLPKTFWTNSVFARVWSKDMICQPPAAIDMRDGEEFRVKMCAQLGDIDFRKAHSLLAQTYYQFLYRKQPFSFREAANPSLNEAISNVFSIMAANTGYLYSQKLISADSLMPKEAYVINHLYKEALSNFVKLPFDIAADQWRIDLFQGKTSQAKLNDRWWALREHYEGVRSPQPYNSSTLDALMHSAILQVHSPASRGLVTYIMQFQILKALCPEGTILSEGCILSEDTTEKLREAMKKGSSISWLKALEIITGKGELDVQPLLDYYEPLIEWLQKTNELDQVTVGWKGDGIKFSNDEIPMTRSGISSSSGLISEDRVAFPGGDCSKGQECLLDSTCNGKTCECSEGLYTLKIGNTHNCVPGNPADSGFGDGKGGLVIGLFPSETTTSPDEMNATSIEESIKPVSSASSFLSFLSIILYLVISSIQ